MKEQSNIENIIVPEIFFFPGRCISILYTAINLFLKELTITKYIIQLSTQESYKNVH